jgi:ADP-heptose:LPS heptosyltransferase
MSEMTHMRCKWKTGSVCIDGRFFDIQDYHIFAPKDYLVKMMVTGNYSPWPEKPVPLPQAKHLLLIRGAGLGDVLMTAPIRRFLKSTYGMKIDFVTSGEFTDMVRGDKSIDKLCTNENFTMDDIDCVVNLNMVEFCNTFSTLHKIDLFASTMGLPRIEDKRIEYHIEQEEIEWAKKQFGFTSEKKTVGLIIQSTCRVKNMSWEQNQRLVQKLTTLGLTPVIFEKQGDIFSKLGFDSSKCINVCGYNVRQAAAALYNCDLVFTPDTGFMHVGTALGRRVLLYTGSIASELVVTPGNCRVINPAQKLHCHPCNRFDCLTGDIKCLNYNLDELAGIIVEEMEAVKK